MIESWQVTPSQNIKLTLEVSSLDEVTRKLPDGYYSTFRTFDEGKRVLGLSAHLRRLYEPVSAPEVTESFLRRQLFLLLEPYRRDEARVRVIMTQQGHAYIALEPLKQLPREIYETGVWVETTELQRQQPRLKSTTFISRSDAERRHITREGIFEALLVKDGIILEGMTSNFFYVKNRILYTAQDDILLGITRKTVIEVARGRGVEIKYEPFAQDQVSFIDEAFITSSSRGIVPVVKIDNLTVGQGRPGQLTKELSAAYVQHVYEQAEHILPVD